MPSVNKNYLVVLRNFMNKPVEVKFNSFYINMRLSSLNIFEENNFSDRKDKKSDKKEKHLTQLICD